MDPLKYFAFFKYVPTLEEYQRFWQQKRLPKNLLLIKGRVVVKANRRFLAGTLVRQKISKAKIFKRKGIISLIGFLPWVRYVGVSGTVSMLNATLKDDIDLFIITKTHRLWTARFMAVLLTTLLRVRRTRLQKHYQDKLCLNLFFSEANLKIPKNKQNEYVAHEILQLKTMVNKDFAYERFLRSNRWIYQLFPLAQKPGSNKINLPGSSRVGKFLKAPTNTLETCLRWVQLGLINRHKTKEIITDTQLWFFPDDFERKLFLQKRADLLF